MPNTNEIVGRNLIKLRTARGMSQSDIGRTSPVSQKTVSNIEKMGAAGSANLETIEALAGVFKTPVWLILLENMPVDPSARNRLDATVKAMLSLSDKGLGKILDRIEELQLLDQAGVDR
jgi:transcriptional regulator with XRE-family HTH domain